MSEHERAHSPEHSRETQEAAAEKASELRRQPEIHEDHEAAEREAESAKIEAQELATPKERHPEKTNHSEHQGAHIASSKTARDKAYKQTMGMVQSQLSPVERTFSKIVHYPPIDKASDVIGKTIARPSSLLAGAVSAFVVVTGLYLIAKFAGFSLQGSETIIAFAVGWIIGLVFDGFRALFFAKRR